MLEVVGLIVCVTLALLMLLMGIKSGQTEKQQVQQRISTLATPTARGVSQHKIFRQTALEEQNFNERVLFPFAQKVFEHAQAIIPTTSKSWVRTKLIQAGYYKQHYPQIFLGIQLLLTLVIFTFMITLSTLFGKVNWIVGMVISGVFAMAGVGLPMLWLVQQTKRRQESIQKNLADFLDLLVISVEAGLALDTAIFKIANMKLARMSPYLREELIRYNKDINFGKPRKHALLDLAERTGLDDLNAVINALIQAYEMGTGVAHTLRVQSDSLRIKRLQKAEEKANKIPVKMVLPIYIFLFPAIFVTIFGPMAMVLLETVMTIFSSLQF
ncbi:MAG: type II secretion system F family protein [Candidatus Melainabacteria bacterium]|nr:type II secretion system F family protein [Candidatus Melainabacteria bacterium]